jgi:hypothetical protein
MVTGNENDLPLETVEEVKARAKILTDFYIAQHEGFFKGLFRFIKKAAEKYRGIGGEK